MMEDIDRWAAIKLKSGSHTQTDKEQERCAMEAVAWIMGEPHSDHPKCASPVITTAVIKWNDDLPTDEERNKWIKPLIPQIIGTRTNDDDEKKRQLAHEEWNGDWEPPYNQLKGEALCEKAAELLGEDATREPWN